LGLYSREMKMVAEDDGSILSYPDSHNPHGVEHWASRREKR